jgi:predicted PurR-regulated permease PerM
MPSINQLLKWLMITLLFPLIFLNLWLVYKIFDYFQPIVITFVLAILFSFILNYPVKFLEKRGLARKYAVILVFVIALLIVAGLGITLIPVAIEQFHEITQLLPKWIESSKKELQTLNEWVALQGMPINLSRLVTRLTQKLPDELQFFGDKVIGIFINTLDSISEAIITFVITFYLLLDGDRIWTDILKKLPLDYREAVQNSLQQNFQNFFVGQIVLASMVGVAMTGLFLFFQLKFAILFGLSIGFFSLVPFGDVFSLGVITLIIASHNFFLALKVLAIAIVIDQVIDQGIAPRLLGRFTGLRPIWVLTSLILGTYIGGLLGLFIAVPIAGLIKDAADGWQGAIAAYSESKNKLEKLPETLTKEANVNG